MYIFNVCAFMTPASSLTWSTGDYQGKRTYKKLTIMHINCILQLCSPPLKRYYNGMYP